MTTATLAGLILGVIVAQVAAVMLLGYLRRRRALRGLDTVVSAWEGYREFAVRRREYEDENRSICSFYLEPVDGKSLPAFRPGQFLTFRLSLPEPASGGTRAVVRCYSLSEAPRPDFYRVSIKRVPAVQPELPPGLSSNFFHDQVQQGTRLQVRAPAGHFHLMEDNALPMVLIGGGIGITPMLSILNSVLERGLERELWLFYGVRNGSEHIMKQQLQALASEHANFHLHVCYSAPADGDVADRDYQHHGRVDMPLLRETLKHTEHQFYVCGPRPMMESLVPGLEEWGVDRDNIHYEAFGPATLNRDKHSATATATQPITVTFSRTGKSLPWDPAADSLLSFAEANGIEVESGCRAGSCGCCQTVVSAGEVQYTKQTDADIEPGHCLLCTSVPTSDLTLDA
jgi:ferredoxin-NADP reductase